MLRDVVIVWLFNFQVSKKVIEKKGAECFLEVKSHQATWKNQRKRRREEQRRIAEDMKKHKTITTDEREVLNESETEIRSVKQNFPAKSYEDESNTRQSDCYSEAVTSECVSGPSESVSSSVCSQDIKGTNKLSLVLHALILLKKLNNNVLVQLSSIGGTDGWNAVHQVLTYLKNHWNRDLS